MNDKTDALIAGLLCLDIIPGFPQASGSIAELFQPGKLVNIGSAVLGTGGAASNTGLALHRLGFDVEILGKIGGDAFGDVIRNLLREHGEKIVRNMIVAPDEGSSYSIILDPPGIDRIILHDAATNNTFSGAEVSDEAMKGARLLHFGYPPIMRKFYENNGEELKSMFRRARALGVTTSLDMARVDPDGPAGRVDWARYCENVLPETDVFLPSADEILFMLDRPLFDDLQSRAGNGNPAALLDIDTIRGIANRLLGMGTAVVALKLGDLGFYLKTTADPARLAAMGELTPTDSAAWLDQELTAPCRRVDVAGTIGAGDCTIAGFLGALLKGLSADEAVAMATAVGGASVEARDAHSGVPKWEAVRERLAAGWDQRDATAAPAAWSRTPHGNYRP